MSANFVAGQYTATYNAKALGQTADGYRLSHQVFKRLVTGDAGGDTPQDAIYRGMEVMLSFRLIEALATGVDDLIYPYAATVGTPLSMGVIGRTDVRGNAAGDPVPIVKSLILTALAGTPAAEEGPATITMPLSILAENYPVEILYAPDLREVPIRMRIYPATATGVFGTET